MYHQENLEIGNFWCTCENCGFVQDCSSVAPLLFCGRKIKIKQIKGILNPNFRQFGFELNKKQIFWNEFWSKFQSSVTSETEDI